MCISRIATCILVDVNDGYLTVSAKKEEKSEDEKHGYIRQERTASCSRNYYVGDIDEDNVKAKYDNGVLTVYVPKKEDKPEKSRTITIE